MKKSDPFNNSYKEFNIKSWGNTDPSTHQKWDHVPRRSKHPLVIGQQCVFLRQAFGIRGKSHGYFACKSENEGQNNVT